MERTLLEAAASGGTVTFDVDDTPVGPERVSRSGAVITTLDGSLDSALASAQPAARAVVEAFRGLNPDELSVEFGVRVDAEAGAVIAKAGVSAHFKINLKLTRAPTATPRVAPRAWPQPPANP